MCKSNSHISKFNVCGNPMGPVVLREIWRVCKKVPGPDPPYTRELVRPFTNCGVPGDFRLEFNLEDPAGTYSVDLANSEDLGVVARIAEVSVPGGALRARFQRSDRDTVTLAQFLREEIADGDGVEEGDEPIPVVERVLQELTAWARGEAPEAEGEQINVLLQVSKNK